MSRLRPRREPLPTPDGELWDQQVPLVLHPQQPSLESGPPHLKGSQRLVAWRRGLLQPTRGTPGSWHRPATLPPPPPRHSGHQGTHGTRRWHGSRGLGQRTGREGPGQAARGHLLGCCGDEKPGALKRRLRRRKGERDSEGGK